MATVSELISQGVTRMRLPAWNPHAYIQPRPAGPWADLYDVNAGIAGGEPVPVLIAVCDEDNRWEPASWRRIGTFTRLETSLGTLTGPGDILLPADGDDAAPA